MQIKTLAEILAESDTDSASSAASSKPKRHNNKSLTTKNTELFNRRKSKKAQRVKQQSAEPFSEKKTHTTSTDESDKSFFAEDSSSFDALSQSSNKSLAKPSSNSLKSKSKKRKKRFHAAAIFVAEHNDAPAYVPPDSQSIQQMLAEVKRKVHTDEDHTDGSSDKADSSHDTAKQVTDNIATSLDQENTEASTAAFTACEIDNLPSALKAYLRTPEQKQAELDAIKAESRLRWLAFYYLSRREYGKAELKQKLIDKEQDPDSIDKLLAEFEEKGYQSDYRTTLMLIRENIRKGRGRQRIKQEFYKKQITMPSNIDELIDMANSESEEFREFVDPDDSLVEGVDWLKLAVEARTKKYGDTIPVEQKEKAKQLRFLQYRGFKTDICFQALNYTLETLDERF
ncbi:regulatory protein RecX [uncultured Psychrobacter sp.]|uniref:regulatory protein RecX n=1 Tax=uncultured Psychrobacter sp. TaxID=259303 RepID=UPI00261E4116|nr:regulatory protein RecX [uncultured Psychrobacter sp.]